MLPHYFFLGSTGPSITEREPCCIQGARLGLLWKVGACSFTLQTRALVSSTLLSEEGISPQQSAWTTPLSYVVLQVVIRQNSLPLSACAKLTGRTMHGVTGVCAANPGFYKTRP